LKRFNVKWLDGGRPPQSPPDPDYPDGLDVVIPRGQNDSEKTCHADIPYPPPHRHIGQWLITCTLCGFKLMMTAASRPDDPKSVTFPCQKHKMKRAIH
jgi:hypothetical protein